MKYALAVFCPPYALLDCGKTRQAAIGLFLLGVAISGGNVGVLIGLFFLQILWAWAVVCNQDAQQEALEFIRAVRLHDSTRRV